MDHHAAGARPAPRGKPHRKLWKFYAALGPRLRHLPGPGESRRDKIGTQLRSGFSRGYHCREMEAFCWSQKETRSREVLLSEGFPRFRKRPGSKRGFRSTISFRSEICLTEEITENEHLQAVQSPCWFYGYIPSVDRDSRPRVW